MNRLQNAPYFDKAKGRQVPKFILGHDSRIVLDPTSFLWVAGGIYFTSLYKAEKFLAQQDAASL